MNRKTFLSTLLSGYFGLKLSQSYAKPAFFEGQFTLPKLGFAYKDLEPHIDAMTIEIHHSKHHQTYISNLNKALDEAKMTNVNLVDLFANISKQPGAIRNNAGGHYNHTFFWELLTPKQEAMPDKVLNLINRDFGTLDKFKTDFAAAATSRFGSGWAWLYVVDGKLKIGSTPNQDNPLMDSSPIKGTPVLALDVWEHAYYLKYQNRRAEYIKAFWNVVNWNQVEKNIIKAGL
jgi:superoxide dismutase, Fe-Mn family